MTGRFWSPARSTGSPVSRRDSPPTRPGAGPAGNPDPLILDDQALIANVAGCGLVVLTGCGHAGVINICRYAQRLTGVGKLHALIGGFHLTGPLFEPIINDTVSALEQLAPDVMVPAHCTGWKATHAIARRLPGAYIQNSVGSTFRLSAAPAPVI